MNKSQSSAKTRCISIIKNDKDKGVALLTQLDNESTIQLLEVCLKKLKDKISHK